MRDNNFVILLPARMGSKGVPFKNRKLIKYTLDSIPREHWDKIYVSTNDPEIKKMCADFGLKIHNRKNESASDTASSKQMIHDFVYEEKISKTIIMLYLTYPERTWYDIKKAYNFYKQHKATSLLCRKETVQHPYLMLEESDKIFGKQVINHNLYRRQDYPKTFEISHFISIIEPWKFRELNNNLYNEKTIFFPIDNKIDVDTEKDIEEFLEKNKLELNKEVQQTIKIEMPRQVTRQVTKEEWKPCTFENYIRGKNVIIVGPSENIKNKGLGVDIDSYDIVIRTNGAHGIIEKYSEDYGSRCDILYTNHFFTFNVLNTVIHNMNPRPKFICYKGTYGIYENKTINDITFRKWDLGVSSELTGMYIIKEIQKLGANSITIAGMDFYQNKENVYNDAYLPKTFNYNYEKENRIHNYENVRNEFNALVKNRKIQVLENFSKNLEDVKKYAVCTVTNDTFMIGTELLIYSFFKHNPWFTGDFIVFNSKSLSSISDENKKRLQKIHDVRFHTVDEKEYQKVIDNFKDKPGMHQRIWPSLYTFETFAMKDYDRVVFLDSDMLITGDMKEAFTYNHQLCVTPDCREIETAPMRCIKKTKMFNGGFLSLGKDFLQGDHKKGLIDLAEKMNPNDATYFDQSIMNEYFKDFDVMFISSKFNTLKRAFADSYFNGDIKDTRNIHYVGEKPWNEKVDPNDKKYSKIENLWNIEYDNYISRRHSNAKIAVIVHVYYEDIWNEISKALKNITQSFDLYVTTTNNIDRKLLLKQIKSEYYDSEVIVTENRGSDIGPFMVCLNHIIKQRKDYDYILKIHSKKSLLVNPVRGEQWRKQLFNSLLGSKEEVSKILKIFDTRSDIGMIGPKSCLMSFTSKESESNSNYNEFFFNYFRKRFNIKDKELKFIAGTMFWCKFEPLRDLFSKYELTIDEFEEGHAPDRLKAHAMERIFPCIFRDKKLDIYGI